MGLLRSIGRFASKAAPFATFIPGVGPIAAAALGAGGKLLEKGSKAKWGEVLGAGGAGTLGAYGLDKAGALMSAGSAAGAGGQMGKMGALRSVGSFAKNNWKELAGAGAMIADRRTAGRASDRIERMIDEQERRRLRIAGELQGRYGTGPLMPLPDQLSYDPTNAFALRRG